MTPEAIDTAALRALLVDSNTSPRPWRCDDEHGDIPGGSPAWCVSTIKPNGDWENDLAYMADRSGDVQQADAELIVAAVNALPALLDALDAARAKSMEWALRAGEWAGECDAQRLRAERAEAVWDDREAGT